MAGLYQETNNVIGLDSVVSGVSNIITGAQQQKIAETQANTALLDAAAKKQIEEEKTKKIIIWAAVIIPILILGVVITIVLIKRRAKV